MKNVRTKIVGTYCFIYMYYVVDNIITVLEYKNMKGNYHLSSWYLLEQNIFHVVFCLNYYWLCIHFFYLGYI